VFLKSLTLKGFKSFADPVTLELEPGVTVVVGPNGSGKSNVVDAIAWVLGAQAPSSVRSQKMDDVIFAGTAKRPALGRAEVALTIDNSAGLLPIEFNEVTVRRTLFRSGDSEYAINNVPCRLLDVQELLSDSGVGRQQHVIVSQGQIDAVLNARPEDRRMIVEEAAGVLKFRRRREKAQRRLDATEGNLVRLQDLLREVRRQLRPLERQAEAARRHGELVAELGALRVHLAGREVGALRSRLANLARDRAALAGDEAARKEELGRLDAAVLAAEAELSALGGFDLGDTLVRAESVRERARGLAALLAERRRGIERDRGGLLDAGVVATLEAEAARLHAELEEVEAEAAGLVPAAAELEQAEAALAAERAEVEALWGDGLPTSDGRAAELRGEIGALRTALDRGEGELGRVAARLQGLGEKADRQAAEVAQVEAELAEAEAAEAPLAEEVHAVAAAREAAEQAVDRADSARREADAERHAWRARADALALALDEARARAGAERLAGVDGVIGTLLDLVAVDEGWQEAFEAAAGEALAAVVVRDGAAAAAALEHLHASDASGAVLALGEPALPAAPPAAGEPVRAHVRTADPAVAALVDRLLAGAVAVEGDWREALQVARRHPGAVVVTRGGDRFAAGGWRVGVAGAGATAGALEEARARAAAAEDEARRAEAELARARTALRESRDAEAAAVRRRDANAAALASRRDRLARLRSTLGEGATEAEALQAQHAELLQRLDDERRRLAELEPRLPALEAEEREIAARAGAAREARVRLEERASAVAALRTDLEVRAAGIEERRQLLRRRSEEVEARLAADAAERAEAEARRVRLDRQLVAVDRLAALVAAHAARVDAELAELHELRRRQSEQSREVSERLDGLRRRRAAEERALEEQREKARRAEIDEAEVRMRLEQVVEALRRDLDTEPDVALAAPAPELPEGVSAAARVRELERELRLMGPINPLALEEFTALQERHAFVEAQLEDVKASRRELQRVIRAVDAEIVQVFSAAYADVSTNFSSLFATLFPGGQGRLILTNPDDLLSTGIEVEARPSGKNVRKLSLLSGGERSLTALAFLFAVFRSRPSPFYVMDEVEAALDDVNLHRFLDLIHEFRSEAQLIIVSHQKRTMEAADCLFGVTMQPGGSSRVVSEKVGAA